MAKIIMATYRAAVLLTAKPRTNPRIATHFAIVICQVRSFMRPEFHDQYTEIIPAMRYGGQVNARVMVRLNPRPATTLGKKFLNPLEARCMCCMKTKIQTR